MKVAVLTGCVQRLSFADVNRATVNVLAAEGCNVAAPGAQGCCGALPLHAGHIDQARRLAKHNIEVFERAGVDCIVVNAAGCGSAMKEYHDLLAADAAWAPRAHAFSAKVRDVSELLAELGAPRAPRQPIKARVAYHDACHLAHGQGVRAQPRALLQAIPGIELLTPDEPEICCGSAGIYNLVQPEPASELGARKARNLAHDPRCVLTVATDRFDLSIEGRAGQVTDPEKVGRVAAVFAGDGDGWPAEARGDEIWAPFSAPSAGPPPWYVFELTPATVFAFGTAEPYGATRFDVDVA